MTAKNEITGDSIQTKKITELYRDNFSRIFKTKCERCGKTLVEDGIHTCTPKEVWQDYEEKK